MNEERVLFEAVCKGKGLFYKNLFDLNLQVSPLCEKTPCIRQACFKIRSEGVQIYTNIQHHIYVNAKLSKQFFESYTLNTEELNIGVSLEYLKNYFKNAKRTDDIIFKIIGDQFDIPNVMCIRIIKTQKNQKVPCKIHLNFEIKITLVQNELLEFKERISNPTSVTNEEYMSICRNIQLQPGWIDISKKNASLLFSFQVNEITKSSTGVGGVIEEPFEITQRFNANCIKNTNKIVTFGSSLNIYLSKYQPMVIESHAEESNISIWVKSNDQISDENK